MGLLFFLFLFVGQELDGQQLPSDAAASRLLVMMIPNTWKLFVLFFSLCSEWTGVMFFIILTMKLLECMAYVLLMWKWTAASVHCCCCDLNANCIKAPLDEQTEGISAAAAAAWNMYRNVTQRDDDE